MSRRQALGLDVPPSLMLRADEMLDYSANWGEADSNAAAR